MVVFNSRGEVLVGQRVNFKGSWQFPQGGIDDPEDIIQAANRELNEEVGIEKAILVSEYPEWVNYDFPATLKLNKNLKNFKGQTQKWFLLFWDKKAEDCKLDLDTREFSEVKFISFETCLDTIVPFKRSVYEKLLNFFLPEIKNYLGKLHSG